MRNLSDVTRIKLCIHEAIRQVVLSAEIKAEYIDTVVDHKVQDFESVFVMQVIEGYEPLRTYASMTNGRTYLEDRTKYEFIISEYGQEPDFFEYLYQKQLSAWVEYIRWEEKFGMLAHINELNGQTHQTGS